MTNKRLNVSVHHVGTRLLANHTKWLAAQLLEYTVEEWSPSGRHVCLKAKTDNQCRWEEACKYEVVELLETVSPPAEPNSEPSKEEPCNKS